MADLTGLDQLAQEIITGKCIERVTVDGRTVEFAGIKAKVDALKGLQEICDLEQSKKRSCRPVFMRLRSHNSGRSC